MKLRYGALSPFVRKVMVLAHERNLTGQLELVPTMLTPTDPNMELMALNPLGKIPTLVLDDGEVLFDSPVVCEYLDSLGGSNRLFPAESKARFAALRLNALGDGLLDAAQLLRAEQALRPAPMQWDKWSGIQALKVQHTLDALEKTFKPSTNQVTIGEIAVGCALGWLDFRMPQLPWREGRPGLAAWYAGFAQRPSMAATAPKAPQ